MKIDKIIEHLNEKKFKSEIWINSLEQRKREELEFHNLDREKEDINILKKQAELDIHANKIFYSVTDSSKDYVDNWLKKNVKGKVFLDYACGDGHYAIKVAKFGAALSIGIDISDVSVKNAQKIATVNEVVDICFFIQSDCENTELPSESIDVIICCGMLHHLDLSYAFPELRRILKPGGKIICLESLSVNPLIQLYRNLTPEMRTDWEKKHILGPKDLNMAKYFFNVIDVKYWHLAIIFAVPFRNTFLKKPLFFFFNFIDNIILKIPFLNRMAWIFTFVLEKPLIRE